MFHRGEMEKVRLRFGSVRLEFTLVFFSFSSDSANLYYSAKDSQYKKNGLRDRIHGFQVIENEVFNTS